MAPVTTFKTIPFITFISFRGAFVRIFLILTRKNNIHSIEMTAEQTYEVNGGEKQRERERAKTTARRKEKK